MTGTQQLQTSLRLDLQGHFQFYTCCFIAKYSQCYCQVGKPWSANIANHVLGTPFASAQVGEKEIQTGLY